MTRALCGRLPARIAAFASLSALLIVPALHGTLDHAHDSCAHAHAISCHVGAAEASLGASPAGNVCPLCLASSQVRTLLPSAATQSLPADDVSPRAPRLPAPWGAQAPLARAICAPRAPPLPA